MAGSLYVQEASCSAGPPEISQAGTAAPTGKEGGEEQQATPRQPSSSHPQAATLASSRATLHSAGPASGCSPQQQRHGTARAAGRLAAGGNTLIYLISDEEEVKRPAAMWTLGWPFTDQQGRGGPSSASSPVADLQPPRDEEVLLLRQA